MNESPHNVSSLFDLSDMVSTYTRAEALADGVLVGAGSMSREVGFRWPVALTAAAWADCVLWRDDDSETQVYQDESGRLFDVLFMASYAARRARPGASALRFELCRVPRDGHSTEARATTLQLHIGPGDHGEPVITIMLPSED